MNAAGDERALERFRSYLLLLARARLDERVRNKLDASDIVQQTMLEAYRDRSQFRGQSDGEMVGWLRQVLARNMANAVRDLGRAKRDVGRERSIQAALNESASRLDAWLAAEQSSPSQRLDRHERAVQLADAMAALPDNQREAIILRHWQGMSLAAIAKDLNCTTAAVTGLLHRGLKALRHQLCDLE